MTPKKIKDLYKEFAEENNISKNYIEDLVEYYYSTIRKQMGDLTHPRLNIEGLGQFITKPGFIKTSIPKIEKMLENHETSTYSAYYNKKMLEEKLEKLKKLNVKISEELKRKEEIKLKRNEEHP